MNKRIFKNFRLSYICAFVIGALFMTMNVNAATKEITENLKLDKEITDNIIVKSGYNVTIDLNGFNITTTDVDAITVENGATLTLKGKGTIEAIGTGVAGLYNNGTTIINDANTEIYKKEYKKVDEEGNVIKVDNYYAILNHGTLTIKNAKVTMDTDLDKDASSLIANGYYDFTKSSNPKLGYNESVGIETPTLIINNGEFSGGINTVKNDDNGVLEINDGHFFNNIQVAVMNWNKATINGGIFEVPTGNDKTTIFVGYDANKSYNQGILTINGGTFKAEYLLEGYTGNTVKITNGNFEGITKSVTNSRANDKLSGKNVAIANGTFNVNVDPSDFISEDYQVISLADKKVVDVKPSYKLNATTYYVAKGDTIKLDYTANDSAKKYMTTSSAKTEIATIKGDVITGVAVGNAEINVDFAGTVETINVVVYELKTDTITKEETTNLNTLINEIANGKEEVKGIDKETSTKLLEAVKSGKTISTELTTKEVKVSDMTTLVKEKVNKVLNKDEKIAAYFDINVLLKADDTSIGKITELENKVKVSVSVPTSLPELKTGYTRKYYVVRIHNGETTKLDATLVNGKIVFETDKFSDYVLTYTDEVVTTVEEDKGKLDDVPKTSDINYTIFFVIFSLIGLVTVRLLRKN